MTNDAFIDFETLSLHEDAAIMQVALVSFDMDDEMVELNPYYSTFVSPVGQDRRIDSDTLKWWLQQPGFNDLRKNILLGVSLHSVAVGLSDFISDHNIGRIWSQGSKDAEWFTSVFKQANILNPIMYRNFRDARTVIQLAGGWNMEVEDYGNKHDAYSDCIVCIRQLQRAINHLNTKGVELV